MSTFLSFGSYNNKLNLFVNIRVIELNSVKSADDISPNLMKHVFDCPTCFVVAVQQKKTLLEAGCTRYLELIAHEVSRWPPARPEQP